MEPKKRIKKRSAITREGDALKKMVYELGMRELKKRAKFRERNGK